MLKIKKEKIKCLCMIFYTIILISEGENINLDLGWLEGEMK